MPKIIESGKASFGKLVGRPLADRDLSAELWQVSADLAQSREDVADLLAGLVSNRDVGAAIGVLMWRHGWTQDEACNALRMVSRHARRNLRGVAREVLLTGSLPPTGRSQAVGKSTPTLPTADDGNGWVYSWNVALERDAAFVQLDGEVDIAAVEELTRLLGSLSQLTMTIYIDLSGVSFLDTSGIGPLVEITRQRRDRQLPPVLLGSCSPQVHRLLTAANLDGRPVLDVESWDRPTPPYRRLASPLPLDAE